MLVDSCDIPPAGPEEPTCDAQSPYIEGYKMHLECDRPLGHDGPHATYGKIREGSFMWSLEIDEFIAAWDDNRETDQ